MMQLPNVRTETEFFAFQGGTDITSPALRMPPGVVISSQNYEPEANGGYSRMKGYERFNGLARPSDATVLTVANSALEEAQALLGAADVRRALIAAPAGSGPVRGVCQFGAVVYAFRDNTGATAGQLYKSTVAGWALVDLGEEVAFTNANISVGDADALTQGAVTATIKRVVLETGSLASGVNTGRLVISGRAGGAFTAAAATSTGGGTLTLGGAQTSITLPAGGRYQFDIYNFFGQLSAARLYGCNGVGPAFEFDGVTLVTLKTGAATDTPKFIKANRKYLYVAQGSSLMNSSVGNPYRWIAGEGSTEIAVGDTITGICSLTGSSLGVMSRNSSNALTGSSTADWSLQSIRGDVGAVPYTLASMSDTFMLDDRGITSITAVQTYGNFADATLSKKVQPIIDKLRTKVLGAYVARQKGHYVLLMTDGATLTMGFSGGQLTGFMQGQLGFTPSCVWSGEDDTGVERIFMGGTDGMVYEMERGSSFDGASIESFLKIYYYNSKSPRIRKRYRKLVLEMSAVLYAAVRFQGEYSYGNPDIEQTRSDSVSVIGSGGSWDVNQWESFYWDAQDVSQPEVSLDGTGLNMALSFYSDTALDFGHTLQGAIIHYTLRRQQR
jgi:hypothetical protein